MWLKGLNRSQHAIFLSLFEKSSSSTEVMFQAQSLLLDFPPLPLLHGAPSLLFPSHGGNHCDPHLGGQSGRLAEQSPLTEISRCCSCHPILRRRSAPRLRDVQVGWSLLSDVTWRSRSPTFAPKHGQITAVRCVLRSPRWRAHLQN